MNKLLEFLKGLLDLSDDQVQKAEKEFKNVEKLEDKIEEIAESQEDDKNEGKGEKECQEKLNTRVTTPVVPN